ncbi:MAG: heme-binding protein [Acidobacteria bacterium]|nr:heme-binding protein [Acidobacteriota bacterium]
MVVAVVDRLGNILALFRTAGVAANATATGNFGQTVAAEELAVALARTAAFFSNDQAPLSSRTVRFISGIHFPPGVAFTPNADLYGIENTNRGCLLSTNFLPGQAFPPARSIDGTRPGLGIITGKADLLDSKPFAVNPGGIPLFNGGVVGGVGVVSIAGQYDVAEFAAFSGSLNSGFLPINSLPPPGIVVIGGISLPFANQITQPAGTSPAGGPVAGTYDVGPSDGALPPEGYLVGPNAGTSLSQQQVSSLVSNTVATASITRAVIRLPQGSRTRMSIAVSDLDGTLLALYRMHDGTVFSLDVAATKARNVVWFSSAPGAADLPGVPTGTAVTNRTISFGAQPFFPPGIDGSAPGPFFQLYQNDVANPCTQGSQVASSPGHNQSGIVFFPGSVPLYSNGALVGGLGVSGDGVDQDDFVTNGGAQGFTPPASIRADQVVIRNVRLPYLKFPRNPTN